MTNTNVDFADSVAHTCYEHYERLPKTGKPQNNKEWTLLAAILCTKGLERATPHIISMATGSKCLGEKEMSPNGNVLNDSHAEILARRGFLRYLYHQIQLILQGGKSEILMLNENDLVLQPDVKLHLFASHTPCGDASIFLKETENGGNFHKRQREDIVENVSLSNKRLKKFDMCQNSEIKNNTTETTNDHLLYTEKPDIYRTGARCVSGGMQDPKEEGINYHILGELRTKPGRGDPTLSMCCSDKIAKWNVCGLQGALLSHFISDPIYLSTIIIGKCPYDKEALQRAVVERMDVVGNLPKKYITKSSPMLIQSTLEFKHSRQKAGTNAMPCPSAIVWAEVPNKCLEVAVNGIRQGVTMKCREKKLARLHICKKELFNQFVIILKQYSKDYKLTDALSDKQLQTYYDYKMAAQDYQECWTILKQHFSTWTEKPKTYLQFVSDEDQYL